MDAVFWIFQNLVEKPLGPYITWERQTEKEKETKGTKKDKMLLAFNKTNKGCVLNKTRKISIIEVV